MRVIWRAAARDDRRRIFDYLVERNPAAAARLTEALILTADSLASFPDRGRPGRAPGTRELVALWPYVIVYRVDPDAVRILRIWHGAQDRFGAG